MKELGRIITLHTISDPRGNLTVAEENIELPFDNHDSDVVLWGEWMYSRNSSYS